MQYRLFATNHSEYSRRARPVFNQFRRLFPLVLLTTVSVLLAQGISHAEELALKAGEIRLDGTVRSVDISHKLLVIDAFSFTLPNGKGNRFPAAKVKNLDIGAATQLHVRGNDGRALSAVDIRAGVSVVVIGKDAGTGKNLPASEIALWDREDNGKYFYGPNPTVALPATPNRVEPVTPKPAVVDTPRVIKPQMVAAPVVAPQVPDDGTTLDITQTPILQIRIKTRNANGSAPDIKLAPGMTLPPALAKLAKPLHLFSFALTTPEPAPEGATGTMSFPAGLGRTEPSNLRVTEPRGMPMGGMIRPTPVEIYWGNSTTIPQGQPSVSEIHALFFGYISRQTRPPESYDGAGSVALPVAAPRAEGAEPPVAPEATTAVGDYSLQTSFTGNANFKIAAEQDFLEPLQVNLPTETPDFSKPLTLTWERLPRAVGYRIRALGTKKPDGTRTVGALWTSSLVAPNDVQDEQVFDNSDRAVKDGLLLDANTTSVTIPAGVLTGMPSVTFIAEAFGPVKVIKGRPSVRIIPMSEKVFGLPVVADDGTGATPRPGGRPPRVAPPQIPTPPVQVITEPVAMVRVRTGLYQSRKLDEAPQTIEATELQSGYSRSVNVTLAAKTPAREDLSASLNIPPKLFEGSNLPAADLPLKISVPSRTRPGSNRLDVKVYAGSSEKFIDGQPQTLVASYDEFRRMDYPIQNVKTDAASIADGPAHPTEQYARFSRRASAVGPYSLKTSYAGNVDFAVAAEQEFMAPIQLAFDSPAKDLTLPIKLSWQPIPGALGYHIYVTGTRNHNTKDAVNFLWTPARTMPTNVWALPLPTDVAQSIKDGVILGPEVTSCTIPAGLLADTKEGRIVMQAFGPQRVVPATQEAPSVNIATTSDLMIQLNLP